jgi:hypothetical protein
MDLDRRHLLGSAAAFTALGATTGRAQAAPAGPTLSLLDVLTPDERADVLSGRNAIDLTSKFTALLRRAASEGTGVTVDCRAWRGQVIWTADPFAQVARLPGSLLTGQVTIRKDFAQGPILIPSHMTWRMSGTEIRPLRPFRSILTDSSPASAMLMSWMTTILFDGRAGERELTMTLEGFARYVVPGAQIGIFGAEPYPAIDMFLGRDMSSSDEGLTFSEPAGVAPSLGGAPGGSGSSLVFLKIDAEIVQGYVDALGRVSGLKRGLQGTMAARHAAGARVVLLTTRRHVVTGVSGRRVTLDTPLTRDFVEGRAVVGSVGARLSGTFVVDGEQSPAAEDAGVWMAVSSVLGTRFTMDGAGVLRRASHGGFMQWGCRDSRVQGAAIEDCGRPGRGLGSAIWGFGGGSGNRVTFDRVKGGHLGVALDNKSYGVPFYGMIDGETGGDYRIGEMIDVEHSVAISGCSGNRVWIGRLNPGAAMPDFDDVVSSRQTTRPVPSVGNDVTIESGGGAPVAHGRDAGRNRLVVAGRRAPVS